jgi:NADPH-dependent F420 reductase
MNIAVIGSGWVGGTLGKRWAQKGHQVVFGSRDPASEKVQAVLAEAGENASATSIAEAAQGADVVLLATPWNAAEETLQLAGNLEGKVLVDCINPLNDSFSGLDLGFTESATEHVSKWSPGARVVKAFNTLSAASMADPIYGEQKATAFYCGDDAEAKKTVHQLAEELDMEPVDAGPMENARYLEPLAMLYIHLAVREKWGSNCAFKILTR